MPYRNRTDLEAAQACGEPLEFLFFWGHRPRPDGQLGETCLSQFWPAPFVVDGIRYPTAEHFMMSWKARLFGDEEQLAAILKAPHPGEAKSRGRQVKGFDPDRWNAESFAVVVQGNLAKFGQNPELKRYLLGTGSRVLVEASPHDRVWGIGLPASDPSAERPSEWQGENRLGFALMEVRSCLQGS
ncbi:MAG: NADAR family protein [Candidatus Eremiobacterota bacterium]